MFDNKLKIDLNLLREVDGGILLLQQIELLCAKIENATKLGKRVTGIIELPTFVIRE